MLNDFLRIFRVALPPPPPRMEESCIGQVSSFFCSPSNAWKQAGPSSISCAAF